MVISMVTTIVGEHCDGDTDDADNADDGGHGGHIDDGDKMAMVCQCQV
jgi:hypothetical protein